MELDIKVTIPVTVDHQHYEQETRLAMQPDPEDPRHVRLSWEKNQVPTLVVSFDELKDAVETLERCCGTR